MSNGIGFIGCGSMGSAIIKGTVNKGKLSPSNIWCYEINQEALEALTQEVPLRVASSYEELLKNSSMVFLAVKPGDYASLLQELQDNIRKDQVLISVAAGISISYLEKYLGTDAKIVRVMPNTPCLVGEGAIAISSGPTVSEEELNTIKSLLQCLGLTVVVQEKDMNAVTGLSGSGPAYVYLFLESLIEGGVKAGLDRETAGELARQTVKGAAEMMKVNEQHPALLKSAVTSPGGTTSYGLYVLEEERFRAAVVRAVEKACIRAKELGERE